MTTPSLFSILLWGISSASKAVVRKSIIFEVELETIHGVTEVKLAGTISIFFLMWFFMPLSSRIGLNDTRALARRCTAARFATSRGATGRDAVEIGHQSAGTNQRLPFGDVSRGNQLGRDASIKMAKDHAASGSCR
jgi:hypothetical protein